MEFAHRKITGKWWAQSTVLLPSLALVSRSCQKILHEDQGERTSSSSQRRADMKSSAEDRQDGFSLKNVGYTYHIYAVRF